MARIAFDDKCIDKTISLEVDDDTLSLVVHREGVATIDGKALRRPVYLYLRGHNILDIHHPLQLSQQVGTRLCNGYG